MVRVAVITVKKRWVVKKGLIIPPTHSTVTGKSLEAVEGNETHWRKLRLQDEARRVQGLFYRLSPHSYILKCKDFVMIVLRFRSAVAAALLLILCSRPTRLPTSIVICVAVAATATVLPPSIHDALPWFIDTSSLPFCEGRPMRRLWMTSSAQTESERQQQP